MVKNILNTPMPETLLGLNEYEDEILDFERQLKKKREELKEAKKEAAERSPLHDLAITLHDMLCNWNHTDGCSWFYEKEWTDYTHSKYLEKASRLLLSCEAIGVKDPIKVLRIAKELKN